ncbi:diguanylate cyclase [Massilia sp. RP-1-19]|uniref:Diguanylate cyclase n=2 Tax=Massilia polaris TaxID=2728846 RepID=A0A848HHT0_9BURK|nr:diguanylate cyclase [Massilia polaris]
MWGAMLYQVDLERQVAHSKAVGQSQSQARALSDYVGNILRQAGHATHVFKLKYEETDGAYPLARFATPGGLLDSVLPVRLAIPMAVYDASGKLADSLNGPMPTSAAAAPYFPALARSARDIDIVTAARASPHGSAWQIQVARRLSAGDGSFAGVVVMVIEPSLFIDDYDRLDIDERSAVVLLSRSASLSAGRLGESLFTSDTLEFNPVGPRGRRLAEVMPDETLDEVPRIYAASELGRDALVAVVGIPRDVALASFERQRLVYLAFALAGGALIAAVTAVLMRQSARLRASIRAAKEAQAMLRGAVHGSLDAFMLLTAVRGADDKILDFIIADINEIGAAILKLARTQLIGQKAFALLPRFAQTGLFGHYVKVLETGQTHSEEFEIRIEGQAPIWIHHQVVPIEGGVAVTSRDITLRKQEEIEIRGSRNFLQSLINNLPLLIYVKSARPKNFGQFLIWNQAAETVTGYRPDQVIGKRDAEAFPPGFGLTTPEEDLAMLDTPMVVDLPEKPVSRPDGSVRYLHTMSVPLFDADGHLEYILCIAEDVTRRREQDKNLREALAALRESEARVRTIADALPAMIAYIDANEVYRFHNASFLRDFLGGPSVLGTTVRSTIGEPRYRTLEPFIKRALAGETVVFEEVDESGGRDVAYQITYIPQTGDDGQNIVGFHVMRQDITSHKREKKQLIMLSQIDALTGLTNRAGFFQKLDAAMQNSTAKGALMAVMYMDIDHFKPVNDTYGHNTGDALLKAFSGRLTHTVRATDTVARLGGDEFTIVMENLARNEDAAAIAAKIVTAMRTPFKLGDVSVSVSTSIGLAFFQGGLLEPEELLKQADMLLYQAKQAGRNTFRAAL